MSQKQDAARFRLIIADSVGIAHFVVAHVALVLGELTNVFSGIGAEFPGVYVVLNYLDLPVYILFRTLDKGFSDFTYILLFAEFIIIITSLLYGFITYLALHLLFTFFD